jgi:LmbE family N-acetylglucosaminyl deacetylase
MATLVSFHAHPDDEAIITGGTLARAASDGHRVVLVYATRGELGPMLDGVERSPDELGVHRVGEAERAASLLGAARVVFLDYGDSGMAGEESNGAAAAFWNVDVDEASARLAELLREENAEVVTTYDERGGYEHPDHIKVHEVGLHAAELAGTPRIYCATVSRQQFVRVSEQYLEALPDDVEQPDTGDVELGVDEARITTFVDVRAQLAAKRAAMAAHASQIPESSLFLSLPDDVFAEVFGTEWFMKVGAPPGTHETWLFPTTA